MDTSDGYTEGEQGQSGAVPRPITRAEEGRVRAAVAKALGFAATLEWWTDGRLLSIDGVTWPARGAGVSTPRLARAGIIPGPEGWCWSPVPAPPHDFDPLCEACKGETTHAPASPAWLTAAVLAALPPDGTPVAWDAIVGAVNTPNGGRLSNRVLDNTLAHLVSTGEIEPGDVEGTWHRWGVPEGWGWRPPSDLNGACLCEGEEQVERALAVAHEDGEVAIYPKKSAMRDMSLSGTATPPTLDAAKRAALRACWERGLFAGSEPEEPEIQHTIACDNTGRELCDCADYPPLPPLTATDGRAVVPTPGPCARLLPPCLPGQACGIAGCPQCSLVPNMPTYAAHIEELANERVQRIRDALLAELARGPRGDQDLLLDAIAAGGQSQLTLIDLRPVLHSIGAVAGVGARWHLSDGPPPGWGWISMADGSVRLMPSIPPYLISGTIANIDKDGGGHQYWWALYVQPGESEEGKDGSATTLEGAQAAALFACRRAGAFAPCPTPVQPGPLPDWVRPAPLAVRTGCDSHSYNPRAGCNDCLAVERAAVLADILAGVDTYELGSEGYRAALLTGGRYAEAFAAWGTALQQGMLDRLDERVARGMREAAERLREGMPARARRTEVKGGMLRVYGEDGETVIHEEQVSPYRETLTEQAERVAHGVATGAEGDAPALRQALRMTQASLDEARDALAMESKRADINRDAADRERAMVDRLRAVLDGTVRS